MNRSNATDFALAALLATASIGYALWRTDFSQPPCEAAATLLRDVSNLATGHGGVFDPSGPPRDGTNDFLVIILAAGLCRLGLGPELAVTSLGLTAHVASCVLAYSFMVRSCGAPRILGAFASAMVITGPGAYLLAAGLPTPVFAAAVLISAIAADHCRRRPASIPIALAFAGITLTTSLVRLDGVWIAAAMWLSLVLDLGLRRTKTVSLAFWGFMVAGAEWVSASHGHDFGLVLPTSFVHDGAGQLPMTAMQSSVADTVWLVLPFLLMTGLALRDRQRARSSALASIPLLVSACMWGPTALESNFGARFHYPSMMLALVAAGACARGWDWRAGVASLRGRDHELGQLRVIVVTGVFLGLLQAHADRCRTYRCGADGRRSVGRMLAEFRSPERRLVTTEPGLVPYESGWPSLDAWGLDDHAVARRGAITRATLERWRPAVIVLDVPYSPISPQRKDASRASDKARDRMIATVEDYARTHEYTLAAAFGDDPRHNHYYYVRRDVPQSKAIIEGIRRIDYHWVGSGRLAIDYSSFVRSPTLAHARVSEPEARDELSLESELTWPPAQLPDARARQLTSSPSSAVSLTQP